MTRDFVTTLYSAAEASVAKAWNLKETMAATREAMDPKFSSFAIYEHCLPFNVSRAFDEASGIDDPVIWTDKRDREMWAALQEDNHEYQHLGRFDCEKLGAGNAGLYVRVRQQFRNRIAA